MSKGMKTHAPGSYSLVAGAAPQAAARDGWWVRVNLQKQQAPMIVFLVGSNNHTAVAWRIWNTGEPNEFDVPTAYRNINPLYIKANSTNGRNSWFCAMYRNHGVKHFDFDDDEDHEMQQNDQDGEC